jgi:hypothetical protein
MHLPIQRRFFFQLVLVQTICGLFVWLVAICGLFVWLVLICSERKVLLTGCLVAGLF